MLYYYTTTTTILYYYYYTTDVINNVRLPHDAVDIHASSSKLFRPISMTTGL